MSKSFLAIIAVIVLIFVGIFAFTGQKTDAPGTKGTATQHIQGKGNSGITLVEYGDYECPFCGQYYPIVKQVQAEYNDKIFFQFRNYPLVSIHQNAFAGARAAEAAALQNKFWEMHDLLYENQKLWTAGPDPIPLFKQYAQQLGLDATKFATDYASSKVNDVINADMAEGNKLKITGTPTFFLVDGKDVKQVQISASIDDFKKVLDAELAKKGSATSSGTTSQTEGSATPNQ